MQAALKTIEKLAEQLTKYVELAVMPKMYVATPDSIVAEDIRIRKH